MNITLPIVIEEPGTLILYNSREHAEHHLEVYDVKDSLYRGWDAEGRLLDISINNDHVVITTNDNKPTNFVELEGILREHLRDTGVQIHGIPSGDLDSLVDKARSFLYTPKSKWEILKDFFYDLFH